MSKNNKGFLHRVAAMHMPGQVHVSTIVPDTVPMFNYADRYEQSQFEPGHMLRFQSDNEQGHKINAEPEYRVTANLANEHLEPAKFAFINSNSPDSIKGRNVSRDQALSQEAHDLSEINKQVALQRTSNSLAKNLERHIDNRKQSELQPNHEMRLRSSEHKSVATNINEGAHLNQSNFDKNPYPSKLLADNTKHSEMSRYSLRPVSTLGKQSQASSARLDNSTLRTESEPVINITIGQIDIRAEQEASVGSTVVKKKAKPQTDKLEAYYQKRMGGSHE